MRVFARPMGIDRLSLEARVLYTVFCAFMLLGGASSLWLVRDDGLTRHGDSARSYYLGDPAPERPAASAASTGPALELPDATDAADVADARAALSDPAALRFAKPPRQVVETFHFHLFTVPVCLLIVGHIFMMCALAVRLKVIVLVGAALSTLFHLLVPPLIRFASPAFAVAMAPSGIALAVFWTVLTAWPIVEMWRPPRPVPA